MLKLRNLNSFFGEKYNFEFDDSWNKAMFTTEKQSLFF